MSRFALDTDVVGTIQRSGFAPKVSALGRLPVVITDTVWDELTIGAAASGANAASVNEATALLQAIAGSPTTLMAGTPEAASYAALQGPFGTEHEGEHSVIAFAVHNPDVVPVLLDKRAALRAIEELRGRVQSLHCFLDVLHRDHGLSRPDAHAISQWFCTRNKPALPPLWW